MTLVMVNVGERLALDYLVNKGTPQNLVLRLFKNDATSGLTPTQINALTQAGFTEATYTGYSAITLTGASWTTAAADPSTAVYAEQTFSSSATQTPQTIYGYYYTRVTGGELVAFEYFGGPVVVEFDGDAIKVTPRITAQDTQD